MVGSSILSHEHHPFTHRMNLPTLLRPLLSAALPIMLSGCMVIAVADAAVTVVGTTVDVAAAGVKAVAGTDEKKKKKD